MSYHYFNLYGAEAKYPRLDQPYNFSAADNRSMPCAYDVPDAKYECSFKLSEAVAKQAAKAARKAFDADKKPDWLPFPYQNLGELFKKDDDSNFVLKSVKKTYGEANNQPDQFLADGKAAPTGFQLTGGSICNVKLRIVPWSYAGRVGITWRLLGLKVAHLADGPVAGDPFAGDAQSDAIIAQAIAGAGNNTAPLDPILGDLEDEINFA